MATEIVILKVKDDFTPAQCERSIAYLQNPVAPGLQVVRWGHTVEDHNTVIWILNWDSVEHHEAFIQSPIYPEFYGTIVSFCTAPVVLYHTHLKPFPPTKAFEAGIIEIANAYKKPQVSHEQLAAVRDEFFDQVAQAPGYHSHFLGVKHEDPNVYVQVIGWDSVESHTASASARTEVRNKFKELIEVEKTSICHVKLHPQ